MRVRAVHGFADFERDATRLPPASVRKMVATVKRNTTQGHKLAQQFAKASSGIHGKAYYKRITTEMTSPLVGEYGPHGEVVDNAVGGGWRNGPPNMDLPRSADIQGPKFAADAGKILDGLYG